MLDAGSGHDFGHVAGVVRVVAGEHEKSAAKRTLVLAELCVELLRGLKDLRFGVSVHCAAAHLRAFCLPHSTA